MTHINRFGNGFIDPALIEYECVHERPSPGIAQNKSSNPKVSGSSPLAATI